MSGNNVRAYSKEQYPRPFHPKPHVVNALLVQSRGVHPEIKCEKCKKAKGNFEQCLKVKGVFSGGCGNCTAQGVQTHCESRDKEEPETEGEGEEGDEEDEEEDNEEGGEEEARGEDESAQEEETDDGEFEVESGDEESE